MKNKVVSEEKRLKEVPPCVFGAPIVTYLRDAKVRQQLHIDPAAPAWDLCNSDDSFKYTSDKAGTI